RRRAHFMISTCRRQSSTQPIPTRWRSALTRSTEKPCSLEPTGRVTWECAFCIRRLLPRLPRTTCFLSAISAPTSRRPRQRRRVVHDGAAFGELQLLDRSEIAVARGRGRDHGAAGAQPAGPDGDRQYGKPDLLRLLRG